MSNKLYALYNGPSGRKSDIELFLQLEELGILQPGKMYIVNKIVMGPSMTSIYLEGVSNLENETTPVRFNSVAFDFYYKKNNKLEKHDIYNDTRYNRFINKNLNTL